MAQNHASVLKIKPAYSTTMGAAFLGDSLDLIPQLRDDSVNLAFTSPPFALLRKKEYGNKDQDEYVEWLGEFARKIHPKLTENGSLVVDLGGAYEKGLPVRSLYNFKVLIYFCEKLNYHLAQEFFWNNPSKLPSPIEWVNRRKIRAKDSINTVWWFSKSTAPKADVRKVLTPYSERMKKLISDPEKFFTPKKRPSGHDIGGSFGTDNGGAIPSNLLSIPNSESNSKYLSLCKELNLKPHPARFPKKLPQFFINFLTDEGDLVVDFFAGSNTTGEACEESNRHWISFEINQEYLATSSLRFADSITSSKRAFEAIMRGKPVELEKIGTLPF